MASRREFLTGLAALALFQRAPAALAGAESSPAVLGAVRDASGAFRIAGIDLDLAAHEGATAPLRLHAVVPVPGGGAIAIARRPGDLAFVLPADLNRPALVLQAAEGRRFAGHGVFLDGGRRFAIAEIDAATGAGTLAFLDPGRAYARVGEAPTQGIGPHEVVRLGGAIAVANGAREPGADAGIRALAESDERANVTLLDGDSGAVRAVLLAPADFAGQSLRHMAVGAGGRVVVAAQETEPGISDRPLLFTAGPETLEPIEADESVWLALGGYVGSVAVDASGRIALVSSPKGGVVTAFDLHRRAVLGSLDVPDVCGLAADGRAGGFVASSGLGSVLRLQVGDPGIAVLETRLTRLAWDNHLAPVLAAGS